MRSIPSQEEVNSSLLLSFILVQFLLPVLENITIMIGRFNIMI
jgi:hypothetical protein